MCVYAVEGSGWGGSQASGDDGGGVKRTQKHLRVFSETPSKLHTQRVHVFPLLYSNQPSPPHTHNHQTFLEQTERRAWTQGGFTAGPCLAESTACYNKKARDWDGGGSMASHLPASPGLGVWVKPPAAEARRKNKKV